MLLFDKKDARLLEYGKNTLILSGIDFNLLSYRLHFDVDYKFCAFTNHALYVNRSAHLLYDVFTNRKPKPGPLAVPFGILIELPEVDK